MRTIDADALIPKIKLILAAEIQIYGRASWGFSAKCLQVIEDAPPIGVELQWIPICEWFPSEGVDVLLQFPSNQGVGYYEDGDWMINTGDGVYNLVGYNEENPSHGCRSQLSIARKGKNNDERGYSMVYFANCCTCFDKREVEKRVEN